MQDVIRRQFRLLDAMILTAAMAAALGLMKLAVHDRPIPIWWLIYSDACCVATNLSWAVIAVRLIPPRPSRAHLFRPPGIAACTAAAVALVAILAFRIVDDFSQAFDLHGALVPFSRRLLYPLPSASAVTATWVLMLADRRWRPEANWIDRFGRIVGILWIILALIYPAISAWVLSR